MTAEHVTSPGVLRVPGAGPRPRVRLSGPAAIVACLPQLVGFPPIESLVLVGMRRRPNGRDEVVMTLRMDLGAVEQALAYDTDDLDSSWDDLDDDESNDVLQALERASNPAHPVAMAGVLVRNECDRVLLVVVSDRARPVPDLPELADFAPQPLDVLAFDVAEFLQASGLSLVDALLVREHRWWSYRCTDPTCCPPEGTPVQQSDAELLQAEMAWAGQDARVLDDRAEIVAAVAARDDDEAAAVRTALGSAGQPPVDQAERVAAVSAAAELMARFGSAQPQVSPQEWARLLTSLRDVLVRDACMSTWRGAAGRRALDLWCAATRLAPAGHVAPPATLAAVVAHARGEGALAGEALERALLDDPTYRMACYAAQALTAGLPPAQIRRTLIGSTAAMRASGEPVLDGRGRLAGPGAGRSRRKRRS